MTNSMIRYDARKILKGQWFKIGLILLIYTAIVGFINIAGSNPAGMYDVLVNDANVVEYYNNLDDSIFSTLAGMVEFYMTVGICVMLINVVKSEKYTGMMLFQDMRLGFKAIALGIIISIFTVAWSMLFIIPGIIKAFSYSMSFYVLAQNPDMPILECIAESQKIMYGHKIDLFCMRMVFVGWKLVITIGAIVPTAVGVSLAMSFGELIYSKLIMLGVRVVAAIIGQLVIQPYEKTSETVFYMYVSGQDYKRPDMVGETGDL